MDSLQSKRYCFLSFWIYTFWMLAITKGQFVELKSPQNVEVSPGSVTHTSMIVTWDLVSKANSYSVSLKPPTISATGVGVGIEEKFTFIEGLRPDTEYLISITAVRGDISSSPSVIAQRTALPSPQNVWVVQESVSADSMTVEWAPVNGSQSYTIDVLPAAGVSGAGKGIYSRSVRLQGMSANTQYTIYVFAVNWVGKGAKAEVRQYTKLRSPRNLRILPATITPTTIGVKWDEVVGAINYVFRITPSYGGTGLPPRTSETHLILSNLEPDSPYRIEVAAMNAAGPSRYAVVQSKTLSMCYAVANDFTEDTFEVLCPSQCGASMFQDQVYGTREYTSDSRVCVAAIHDGRVTNNAGGIVKVKKRPGLLDFVGTSKNGVITKDYKTWHRSFVFALQAPPSLTVQSAKFNQATITWGAVSGAEAYHVSITPSQGVTGIDSNIEDTRITLSGLQPKTEYRVYVSAVNHVERSDASTILLRTTLPAPTDVHVVANSVLFDRLTVAWDAMSGVAHYLVVGRTDGHIAFKEQTEFLRMTLRNLTSGIFYNISVQAVNEIGQGQPAYTSQYTKLHPPQNAMVLGVTENSIEITWDPILGATRYNVTVSPCCYANVIQTAGFSRTVRNLQSSTLYNISISAINENEQSSSVIIQQMTVPEAPNLQYVADSLTHNNVTIAWGSVPGALNYSIEVFDINRGNSKNYSTDEKRFKLTGLTQRTTYGVNVAAYNRAGYGKKTTLSFTTLIAPPTNAKYTSDALRSDVVFITWDKVTEARQYYVGCEPSEGITGFGATDELAATLQGLQMGVPYTVKIMAQIEEHKGMNATLFLIPVLPVPKLVSFHSVIFHTIKMTWDSSNFKISKVVYDTLSTRAMEMAPYSTDNQLIFDNLKPDEEYRFRIFSTDRAFLVNDGPQNQPLLTESVRTGSNITTRSLSVYDVQLFWPPIPDASNYLVMVNPYTSANKNTSMNSLVLNDFNVPLKYMISVTAEAATRGLSSEDASVMIQELGDGRIDEGGDYETDHTGQGGDTYYPNVGPPQNNNGNEYSNNGGNENNYPGANSGGDADVIDEEKPNNMWIAILIVAVCLVVLLLITFIVCSCCCKCCGNKPLLRHYGCCLCCHRCCRSDKYYDVY
ncbi:unnamed protein product [Clavelina lepadiformis]|uniref:Uncharacterized protein n=1 Tax=Clavelina lepadiformis TaxID=159417 RepID=A0ABP0GQ33_CLALP